MVTAVWQSCIFKVGDDCRQDVLTLQLIALLQNVFTNVGLDLYTFPYKVVATSPGVRCALPRREKAASAGNRTPWGRTCSVSVGAVVCAARPVADKLSAPCWRLCRAPSRATFSAASKSTISTSMCCDGVGSPVFLFSPNEGDGCARRRTVLRYFIDKYGDEDSIGFQKVGSTSVRGPCTSLRSLILRISLFSGGRRLQARANFTRSMAAYSILMYLFTLRDRHNGNVLVDEEGHIVHIGTLGESEE